MKRLLLYACIFLSFTVNAQDFKSAVVAWQQHYKQEFLNDPRSPLKAADTGFLRFYKPNKDYRVKADFVSARDQKAFDMATHSGQSKQYRLYGRINFRIHQRRYTLEVYQSMALMSQDKYRDQLFIPFTDLTNGATTYGGGRYLDLKTGDIANGTLVLDFNKAYNPYCAFGNGYACPIPPDANRLNVRIEAGEQNFGRTMTGE